MKNIAIIGGFLCLFAAGPGALAMDRAPAADPTAFNYQALHRQRRVSPQNIRCRYGLVIVHDLDKHRRLPRADKGREGLARIAEHQWAICNASSSACT